MRKVIRKSLFETASSSVHALVVGKTPVEPSEYSKLVIYHGEWGWSVDEYSTPSEKASYLFQCLVTYLEPEKAKEAVNPLEEILKKNGIEFEYEPGYFEADSDEEYFRSIGGYIDHSECAASVACKLLKDEKDVLQFIFGKDSTLITGNDNGNEYGKYLYKKNLSTREKEFWTDREGVQHEYVYYKTKKNTRKVKILEKGN